MRMRVSVDRADLNRWLHLNHLVISLLCFLETIQCHSVVDAGLETTQDFQFLTPKQPSKSLKALLIQQRSEPQLEQPPSDANNSESSGAATQISTTSKPAASSSRDSHQGASSTSTTTSTASPKQRWIDNILINVEMMNIFDERRRQQIASDSRANQSAEQEAQDEPPMRVTSFDESASFQVPTDSGEDLLESQGETSTTSSEQQAGSAARSVDSEDERLIESNNVSAILVHESSRSVPSEDNEARIVTFASKQVMSCESAYTQCALREVCAPTLKLYNDECHDLLNNRTDECSAKCLRAMIALRSSEAGEDLANCDCQGNEFCQLNKQRSQLCQAQVEQALEPTSVVSCSVASSICMANQLCSTALGYYYRRCQSLFSQRHCSDRCNNSLTILYKQPQAMKLINCQCDGSEEFPCSRYKTYTERLCLNKQTAPTTPKNESSSPDELLPPLEGQKGVTGASHLEASADEYDPQAAPSNEDDGLNLTNDPSDLPASFANPADRSDDDSELSGPLSGDATDAANANNYFFNGIQQPIGVEDNWIPLVSGRYFTNLHQQLQRRQQQQQQQKVKQQQRKSNFTKRAQKNAKQKVRPNETNRKRHSRPYMFALTSAATQASHSFILLTASCFLVSLHSLLTYP